MTVQEIDDKREFQAVQLLRRSGVGFVYAINTFTPKGLDEVCEATLAGTEAEALVKIGLQFAFSNLSALRQFAREQQCKQYHKRTFQAVR